MDLEAVAEELYGVPPADFTSLRNDHAAQAKADGDKEAAAAIAKLRKPTVAAWLVNLLAREHPDELEQLVDLGGAMRQAQLRLSGAELKELSKQRHRVVDAMARKAVAAAGDRGVRAPAAAVEEVRQTLQAALADADVGDEVRAGRLLGSVQYSGFGPAKLTVVKGGGAAPTKKAEPKPPAPKVDRERIRRAQEAADAAAAALEEAEAAYAEARSSADTADATAHETAELVVSLRSQLRDAERDERNAKAAQEKARKTARSAERERDRAQKAADDTAFTLERAQKGR